MELLFVCYPGCSTCAKARKWMEDNHLSYTERNIKTDNPTAEELEQWIHKSGAGSRKFFNTSGQLYRKLELKDKVDNMDEQERLALLATDGMLVKRPILIGKDFVLVGFRPDQWQSALIQ